MDLSAALEQELERYYLDAKHGNRVVVSDIDVLSGMVKRGFMPHSVILGESEEAKSLEPAVSSLGAGFPVFRMSEEAAAGFLSGRTGKSIRPQALSAAFEIPVLPFTVNTLKSLRRVVILNHSIYVRNIARVIDLCIWFGVDALCLFETAKSPFHQEVSLLTDFRNLGLPIMMLPDDPKEYIPPFVESGFNVIATALRKETLDPEELRRFSDSRTALLFGNESFGLRDEDIDMCDYVLRIPMAEGIDSLNVAEACSIALFELTSDDFTGSR